MAALSVCGNIHKSIHFYSITTADVAIWSALGGYRKLPGFHLSADIRAFMVLKVLIFPKVGFGPIS